MVALLSSVPFTARAAPASVTARPAAPSAPAAVTLLDVHAASSQRETGAVVAQGIADAMLEAHLVDIDLQALQTIKVRSRKGDLRVRGPVLLGQSVRVIVPKSTEALTLQVNKVEQLVEGVVTYSGDVADIPESFFTLSVHNGRLLGKILIGQASFMIKPATGQAGRHELILLDRALLPRVDDTLGGTASKAAKSSVASGTEKSGGTGSGNVRVLFLFANNVGNQASMAANIVSEFNNALARSAVAGNNKITSAGVMTVASGFTGAFDCRGQILHDMDARDPPFGSLDQWMIDSAADMAFLVVKTTGSYSETSVTPQCSQSLHPLFRAVGAGRVGGLSAGFFGGSAQTHAIPVPSASPFALSMDTYALADLTALHEIGHTLGGQHPNSFEAAAASYALGDYSHGLENDNAGHWQTIMGGYATNRCVFSGMQTNPALQECERIAYFSNPNLTATVNGQTVSIGTNVNTDLPGTQDDQFKADMESWLETSGMPIVSGYRADPQPPASAPALSIIPGLCFGQSDLSWNTVSGATSYQLYKSTSSSFLYPSVIYSGSGTFTSINVPSNQSWYLKAKACNAGGCSGYSSQVIAHYINSCL